MFLTIFISAIYLTFTFTYLLTSVSVSSFQSLIFLVVFILSISYRHSASSSHHISFPIIPLLLIILIASSPSLNFLANFSLYSPRFLIKNNGNLSCTFLPFLTHCSKITISIGSTFTIVLNYRFPLYMTIPSACLSVVDANVPIFFCLL